MGFDDEVGDAEACSQCGGPLVPNAAFLGILDDGLEGDAVLRVLTRQAETAGRLAGAGWRLRSEDGCVVCLPPAEARGDVAEQLAALGADPEDIQLGGVSDDRPRPTPVTEAGPPDEPSGPLPGHGDLFPYRPWTAERRARLRETPWAKVGEVGLATGKLTVGDHIQEDEHNRTVVELRPGPYAISTRSCTTDADRVTTRIRVARSPGGRPGDILDEFHVGTGGIGLGEHASRSDIRVCFGTVFGDGYYHVVAVVDGGEVVGIEIDLLDFHFNCDAFRSWWE